MEKRPKNLITGFLLISTLTLAGMIFIFSSKVDEEMEFTESYAASTVEQVSEVETIEEVLAPNGKMTLILKSVQKGDLTTQTFYTKTDEGETQVEIYSVEKENSNLISIPFNTFSPDNEFIFLKNGTNEKPEYLVLRTDGEMIDGKQEALEFTSRFYEKYPEHKITAMTGWGGYTLIVINSDLSDGKTGPSFWFDVSNFTFIQPSTRFN